MTIFSILRQERAEHGGANCSRHQNDDGKKQ